MNQLVSSTYAPLVAPARARFEARVAKALLDPALDAISLELFLIHFCGRAVQMTEPVEHWIYRAGTRCEELGLTHLGRALKTHSHHEANHHLMLLADVDRLCCEWNKRHAPPLSVDGIVRIAPTPAIDSYVRLHEAVISSDAPFCQIAIEYEIEGLSVSLGPGLVMQCRRLLGSATVESLSFISEHVEIDVGHTKFNEAELGRILEALPDSAAALARAGSAALDAYGAFLLECLAAAAQATQALSAERVPSAMV